ncbi:hypothetical protein PV05_09454 [Exophiala xenobiotica]|uniref:Uncharacterized protein n=1 Tax=Exophiala xenobiotica TaxID=348802 RepID=A0A0D2E7F2_9EURO|nr:uncharacterized protein PV05_09454 [Exophiala xenobiotica]KIW50665.1 hypothetical protein PV05_09454 [Exophiala xenobiotica]
MYSVTASKDMSGILQRKRTPSACYTRMDQDVFGAVVRVYNRAKHWQKQLPPLLLYFCHCKPSVSTLMNACLRREPGIRWATHVAWSDSSLGFHQDLRVDASFRPSQKDIPTAPRFFEHDSVM